MALQRGLDVVLREGKRMKILVVEDDLVSRKLLQATLERLGYDVVLASNGEEAWKIFKENPTPVIISDWMMPELDGLKLCEYVRKEKPDGYTYFILLTARTGRENYMQAMEIGVDDFLTKPLDVDELLSRLRVAERIMHFVEHIHNLHKKLVTICMYTKQVKISENEWVPVEKFFHDLMGIEFSHGISPQAFRHFLKEDPGSQGQGANSPK